MSAIFSCLLQKNLPCTPISNPQEMNVDGEVLNLVIGRMKYTVFMEDVVKHPGSLLAQIASESTDNNGHNVVERDGALFRYINSFLVNGQLPRDVNGNLKLDASQLAKLRDEADFFRLPALKTECGESGVAGSLVDNLPLYRKVHNLVHQMGSVHHLDPVDVVHKSGESPLIQSLKEARVPAFTLQTTNLSEQLLIAETWSVEELIQFAQSQDPTLKEGHSFSIDAAKVNRAAYANIVKQGQHLFRLCFPGAEIQLVPVRLYVDTAQGGARVCAPVLEQSEVQLIGAVIVLFESDYTGGDILVSDNKHVPVETLPRGQNCLAVNSDCTYTMDRVSAGARVSLMFDVVCTACVAYPARGYEYMWCTGEYSCGEEFGYRTSIPASAGMCVLNTVETELSLSSYIVIALQHVYPARESTQAHLRGGDRALYDLLQQQYDLKIVSAVVYYKHPDDDREPARVEGALFTPDIVAKYLAQPLDRETTRRTELMKPSAKLFLSHNLQPENVMHYQQYAEYTQQEHEAVYLVSALQLSKKE